MFYESKIFSSIINLDRTIICSLPQTENCTIIYFDKNHSRQNCIITVLSTQLQ